MLAARLSTALVLLALVLAPVAAAGLHSPQPAAGEVAGSPGSDDGPGDGHNWQGDPDGDDPGDGHNWQGEVAYEPGGDGGHNWQDEGADVSQSSLGHNWQRGGVGGA